MSRHDKTIKPIQKEVRVLTIKYGKFLLHIKHNNTVDQKSKNASKHKKKYYVRIYFH